MESASVTWYGQSGFRLATARIVLPAPVTEIAARGGLDPARVVGAAPGEELRDRGMTVHPVPALHGIGGDQPVAHEFAPAASSAWFTSPALPPPP